MIPARIFTTTLASAAALGLAACGDSGEAPTAEVEATLHEVMIDKIDPLADDIWAVGNAAIDDKAQVDPALMTDESWARLEQAALALQAGSLELGALDPVVVTRPGKKIADEGEVGGSDSEHVQANIDANTQLYRDMANTLAAHVGEIAAGAEARDAARVSPLINQLDGVCESCHLEFWYPAQKEMLKHLDPETQRDAGLL